MPQQCPAENNLNYASVVSRPCRLLELVHIVCESSHIIFPLLYRIVKILHDDGLQSDGDEDGGAGREREEQRRE